MTVTESTITYSAEGPKLSETRLAAFESKLGYRLPEDYRAFLLKHNGGRPSRRRFQYDAHDRTFLNCYLGLDRENEALDIEEPWELSRETTPAEILVIGYDDGGALVTVTLFGPHAGEIWFCLDDRPTGSNPRVTWYDRRDVMKLANSFTEFTSKLLP